MNGINDTAMMTVGELIEWLGEHDPERQTRLGRVIQTRLGLIDYPEMMTIDEVAEYLRTSRSTVRRMIVDDGSLPGRLVGNRWIVHRADVAAYVSPAIPGAREGITE